MHRLYYTDQYTIPLPDGHKFPMQKYRMVRQKLTTEGRFDFKPAEPADEATVRLVHGADYVRSFLAGELPAATVRKIGFPWSEGLVKRTMASVGATLAATNDAIETGWGGTLAGGTHHAFADDGSGFCVFNDIAIAIRKLQSERRMMRAAVIDLDVHQGDGTAHIFESEQRVMTLSVHCKNNFPLRKQKSTLDIALESGLQDDEYLEVLREVLPRAFERDPEIIFYQAGVDTLKSDRLGHLALTHAGLQSRDRMVMTAARERKLPLVITMGGGYSEPIELTAEAHANTFRIAVEVFG